MDFQSLIRIAQQNSQAAAGQTTISRKETKSAYYSTKYEPPKKQNKEKKISANVQKFLQSQEQNSKPNVNKAAFKNNQQLEQDAYESREAAQIYEKLLNRFEAAPPTSTPKMTKSSSGNRVMSKAKDEKAKSSKSMTNDSSKKSEHKSASCTSKTSRTNENTSKSTKPSKPCAPKPVMDFNSLLKLAEQNKAGSKAAAPSKSESSRLLTEKEKRKIAAEKERRNPQIPNHSKSIPSSFKEDQPTSSTRSIPDTKAKRKSNPAIPEKTRAFPPADVRTRQFPPADMAKSRQFPPNDLHTRRPLAPNPKRRRNIIADDDSEYDSEMDDFIDDDDGADDYSQHIKDIFGYDKSRYRQIDDDADDNMVSTFAQQMREEQISKKIGLMEDLEDMRAEAAAEAEKERRRKAKK